MYTITEEGLTALFLNSQWTHTDRAEKRRGYSYGIDAQREAMRNAMEKDAKKFLKASGIKMKRNDKSELVQRLVEALQKY